MRIMVVGLGSMGRRRIRLLKLYDSTAEIIGVDTQKSRRDQAACEFNIAAAENIEAACRMLHPEAAFISAPPLSHAALIAECLNRNLHVFTELNLTDEGYEDNMMLAEEKGAVLFLSSTFLYRREIQYIKQEVSECGCRLSYMYHAGQYLPDWHPWESCESFFAGDKRTNGCRELMAAELPWIFDVFGDAAGIFSACAKNSTLAVDFPDTYQLLIEHESGSRGMITFDVVSRKAARNLEITGEGLYITWDGTPDGLVKHDYLAKKDVPVVLYGSVIKRPEYSASIIEDAYLNEIEDFMDAVNGKGRPLYSFERDRHILSKIDEIEGIRR